MEARVSATGAALAELFCLRERHGPLMLFQSGGCCEGSSPQCLHEGELLLGPNDLYLGEVDGTPFYIDAEQYRRWAEPRLLLDLEEGPADTFSLEGPEGVHFVTRTLGRVAAPATSCCREPPDRARLPSTCEP